MERLNFFVQHFFGIFYVLYATIYYIYYCLFVFLILRLFDCDLVKSVSHNLRYICIVVLGKRSTFFIELTHTHIMKNKQPKISNYFETSQILLLIKQPD